MNLNIQQNQFTNIVEIWVVGSNSVEVITKNDNHYRIIAKENIRSGATPGYYAAYDKLDSININNTQYEVWIRDNTLPWQDGNTIENCILPAISWVNDQR